MKYFIAFFMLIICSVSIAESQVYKWIDKNGRVHYSSSPPRKSQNTQKVNIEEKNKFSDSGATQPTPNSIDQEGIDGNDENAKIDAATAKVQAEICDKLKLSREQLKKSGIRLVTVDADGKKNPLNEAQKKKRLSEINKRIASEC